MESSSNKLSLLLEANLRFLSANLQLNSIVLNTLNNTDALDENQSVLNNLLNWLKSLSQLSLTQSEITLIDSLKDTVRKAKAYDFVMAKNPVLPVAKDIPDRNKASTNGLINDNTVTTTEGVGKVESDQENQNSAKEADIDQEQVDETAFFYRNPAEPLDRWDYISNIQSFITSYEHLMHLLMPNLAFEVVNELHRYDCKNKLIINEAVTYPSVLLQNMITKFLREAPGSNLFRRIRRIKLDSEVDIGLEQSPNIGERKNIKSFVQSYFDTLTKFLDPEDSANLGRYEDSIKANFKQFSLGPASVEMRLTAVIKHVTESALNDADHAMNNENASLKTKIIYLATTQLLCDFQNFLLNEPRIIKFLEDLKS